MAAGSWLWDDWLRLMVTSHTNSSRAIQGQQMTNFNAKVYTSLVLELTKLPLQLQGRNRKQPEITCQLVKHVTTGCPPNGAFLRKVFPYIPLCIINILKETMELLQGDFTSLWIREVLNKKLWTIQPPGSYPLPSHTGQHSPSGT